MDIKEQTYTDDAKRICNEMNLHAVAKSQGWVVFRLSDGSPVDHVPYPTRIEAVRHMRWDRDNFLYLEIAPDGMPSAAEAQGVLDYARALHDAGFRLPSPDFDFDNTMPAFGWDKKKTIRHLTSGGKIT